MISRQQGVERRGPCARCSDHHDWFDDALLANRRVFAYIGGDLKSNIEEAIEETMSDPSAQNRESRVSLERLEQQFERFEEVVTCSRTGRAECTDITSRRSTSSQSCIEEFRD